MFINLLIKVIPTLLALAGLLVQPKKDVNKPISFSNLNKIGIFMCVLIFVLGAAGIYQMIESEKASIIEKTTLETNNTNLKNQLNFLNKQVRDLNEQNKILAKIVSVADGYNARIRGIILFDTIESKEKIYSALTNLFTKFININLVARNEYGEYHGRIDHSINPHVSMLRRLSEMAPGSGLTPVYDRTLSRSNSYFFELKMENLKILNNENTPFFITKNSSLMPVVQDFQHWSSFNSIYHVRYVYLSDLLIEELEGYKINRHFEFQ